MPCKNITKYKVTVWIPVLIVILIFLTNCSKKNELKWVEEDGYRWAELQTGFFGATGFKKLSSSRTGIQHRNDVEDPIVADNRHYLNGSGAAVGDVTGNGFADIYLASLNGANTLYENLGNYQFRDITQEAGVAHEGYNSTGVAFVDVNGNGYLDLLVSSLSDGNALYVNDGEGKFELMENSGLGESLGAHTMAFADINGDGLLDLYLTNYKIKTARDIYSEDELALNNTLDMQDGELVILPPFDEYFTLVETAGGSFRNEIGEADELYLNRGDGVFEKVNDFDHFFDETGNRRGLSPDWGLTATFRDITGNMLPDLYVANDFWTPDRIWINQGDGTFRLIDTNAIRNMSFSSMGVDMSDINRDGYVDIVVTEMLSQKHSRRLRQSSEYLPEYEGRTMHHRNSVYLNRGDTTFAQIAHFSGLEASEWSWATYFLDVNLNGFEDLIIATGFGRDYQDMDTQIAMFDQARITPDAGSDIMKYPVLKLSNKIFKNNGDLTFTDRSNDWGFNVEDMSLGMALGDLNNDGTMDLIINRLNDEAAVYRNRTNAARIAIRLNGESPNTYGIGAKVKLEGGPEKQIKEIVAGGNYLSGSQAQVVFAAEKGGSDHTLTVFWPGGKQSVVEGLSDNRIYEIDESAGIFPDKEEHYESRDSSPLFEDISDRIQHNHHENEFDDFRIIPMLPLKLSRLGPGVAWIDQNRNGKEDLFITSGKGGHLAIYENMGDGEFEPVLHPTFTNSTNGDMTSIIGWGEHDNTRIAVGNANYEQESLNVPSAFIYTIGRNGETDVQEIPGVRSTTGPIAATDYTGNGYVDLFIGGRHIAGRYPESANSRLFRNKEGNFVLDEENSRLLTDVGLVTGVTFADFTGNGEQDLLLSTEWGSLKLFENNDGRFREVTEEVGLGEYKGWWNGIAAGDFTNNGRPDIIALNLGLNSAYQLVNDQPLRMYYDDFNWDGRLNILETYYSTEVGDYVPRRKLHDFESIPTILRNVSSHTDFSVSSIDRIFNQSFEEVPFKEVNTLAHMLFINTGDGFVGYELPQKAQFSSGFSALVADFDNDGNEDLFISQNFFAFPHQTPRLDAGRGLILKGDGNGNFTQLKGNLSGIKVYGEQRGAAIADFNENGRVDLVVSQNNGQTKLFENRTENSGVRIRLEGPSGNLDAIGSGIRIVYEDGTKGPQRFVQAGSGYWSQNGATQVMGINGNPDEIEIIWFDNTRSVIKFDDLISDYTITY